jgi:hypothetical protein
MRFAVAALAGLVACASRNGGSPDGGERFPDGHSGLPLDARYVALSPPQKAQFCDWEASIIGGYGKLQIATCDNGRCASISLPDQASCVADFDQYRADCEATVADGESCVNDPCGTTCPLYTCLGSRVATDAGAD